MRHGIDCQTQLRIEYNIEKYDKEELESISRKPGRFNELKLTYL
jgi:hypothetical protein